MNVFTAGPDTRRRNGRWLDGAVLLFCILAAGARGAPPIDPLPAPLFSFHANSPAVQNGFVDPDAILMLDFPHPNMMHEGGMFGMGRMGDDLDALSVGNASFPSDASFALLFSVDENSAGAAAPDPDLVALGVPYNALDQAARGHAAGDQFMSSTLFLRTGRRGSATIETWNNVLVRNNFDEGGTDFSADPPTSADDIVKNEPQDRVDATVADPELGMVFFSASTGSPSLDHLPGSDVPSGAHIFHHMFGRQQMLFALFSDLGLVQDDDIDAMIVFDDNDDSTFNGSDQVLFSLTPDSPSLTTIPGASTTGPAADVFVARPGQSPALFASAFLLGLGDPQDNIDALEYLGCDDAQACAAARGIRGPGPVPTLSAWGLAATMLLLFAAGMIVLARRHPAHEQMAGFRR